MLSRPEVPLRGCQLLTPYRLPITEPTFILFHTFRNGCDSAFGPYVYSFVPLQTLQETSLDTDLLKPPIVKYPAAAVLAEIALRYTPAASGVVLVHGDGLVVRQREPRENCRRPKGGRGLSPAVCAVAMIQHQRLRGRGREGHGTALTFALHDPM